MILKILSFVKSFLPELTSLLILLILIPLYSLINFYQNDDWNRNSTVIRFLSGDFSLLQVTATTFYSQGILGFLWAWVLGPTKIPYLTLLISVGNFYLFWKILQKMNILTEFTRFLVSLLLLTNPLHAYSSIGFMTENYVIFYLLLAIYFYYQDKTYLSAFFGVLAFFAKQNALVFLIGISLFCFLSQKINKFKIYSAFSLISLVIYYFIFPRTSEMKDKDFNFLNLTNFDYIFSLTYGILIYLVFFTLPLVIYYLWKNLSAQSFKYILLVLSLGAGIYFSSNYLFKPGLISWEEFPYFENTFERTGFLPRTVDGTKYQFKFNYDFYFYVDLTSKIFLSFFLATFFMKFFKFEENKNEFLNFNLFVMDLNFFLMIFVSIFFDRYILLFLPFLILYLVGQFKSSFILHIFLVPYLIFQVYFSYFLTADFIYSHHYIWTRANELVNSEKINPQQIDATGAWNRNFKLQNPIYVFSYDSPKVNENYRNNFTLVETRQIDFKGNLFINPKIYLYQLK